VDKADPQYLKRRRRARRIDAVPFLAARARRFLFAHHWARVDLALPKSEAEIATEALVRRGWRRVALVDGAQNVLVFSVRVGSGDSSAPDLLAQELTAALADARVRQPLWYSIDADLPAYQPLREWRTPPPPPGSASADQARSGRVRTFAPGPGAPPVALVAPEGDLTEGMELVGTLSERVEAGAARLSTAWKERPGGVVFTTLAAVMVVVALGITQKRWPAPGRAPYARYLWLHDHRLALALAASVGVALAAEAVARQSERRVRPTSRAIALLAGSAAFGLGVGGLTRLDRSWTSAGGAGLLLGVGWAWRRAGYVRRRLARNLLRLASFASIAAMVGLYGRSRAWSYYTSMGLRPSAIDVPALDAAVLAVRPVVVACVTVAFFLALAWFVSGHMPLFPGPAITLVAVAAGVSLLVGQLELDRGHGRAVGRGQATPSTEHVAFDPGPTPVCVEWIATELAPAVPGPLPRLVWQIGTAGSDTLLLDPEVARTTYLAHTSDSSAQKAHLSHGDVDAPIWRVPAGQFLPRQPVNGRCEPLHQPGA
jgi:hypothetical protein